MIGVSQNPFEVWFKSSPYDPDLVDASAVTKYFARRNLSFQADEPALCNFRFCRDKENTRLIFALKDENNRLAGILNTYIAPSGAYLSTGWKILRSPEHFHATCTVRFNEESEVICLTRAVDSALVIAVATGLSTVAALTPEMMERFVPSERVKFVIALPQSPEEKTASENLKKRLEASHRHLCAAAVLEPPRRFHNWVEAFSTLGLEALPSVQVLS